MVNRQEQRAGEKLFVDYAGPTMPIINRRTDEIRHAQILLCRGHLDAGPMKLGGVGQLASPGERYASAAGPAGNLSEILR